MKVFIPVVSKDKSSKLSEVFGRSEFFAIYDTETKNTEYIDNGSAQGARGVGVSVGQLAINSGVSKVVTRKLGPNAVNALESGNIEVVIQENTDKTLEEIIQSL